MPESEYYVLIKQKIGKLLSKKIDIKDIYLEITSTKGLSEKLKKVLPKSKNIIFSFLTKKPDITGIIIKPYSPDFIIVEIKEHIKLKDIYQTKMYKELLGARYTFLVTLNPIPEEMNRLCNDIYDILSSVSDGIYRFFVLTHFDKETKNFTQWVTENPFKKNGYWQ